MLYAERRMTKDEIRTDSMETINGPYFGKRNVSLLTLKGKKATLTKWIKQAEEWYIDALEAYKRPFKDRYYFGNFIYSWVVTNAKLDIEVLKEMRKELDECQENDTYASHYSNEGY